MRCFHSLVLGVAFLQVFWISFSNGQDNTETTLDCSTVTEKSECCDSQNSCVFVNCTVDGVAVAACYASVDDPTCENIAENVDTCHEEEETNDEQNVDCGTYTSKEECCAAGNSTCAFFTCTDGDGGVVSAKCVAADADRTCDDETDTAGDNVCVAEKTPEDNAEENPEEGEEVDCPAFNDDKAGCCAAGNSSACVFFNCTDENGQLIAEFCTADAPACSLDTDTPSADICKEPEPSGTTPLPAPSSVNPDDSSQNGEGGASGQNFDAASFIGGIVLCAGLLAIAFFGVKYYRSRQDRNYESM